MTSERWDGGPSTEEVWPKQVKKRNAEETSSGEWRLERPASRARGLFLPLLLVAAVLFLLCVLWSVGS